MEVKLQLKTSESIIAIQKQLRIAIQNHQVLAAKKHLTKDEKIKFHLDIIKWLILSMGRSQAKLLAELRNEIALKYSLKPNSSGVTNMMKSMLAFPETPKSISVYKKNSLNENDNKKPSSWKPKLKSVLKVNNKEFVETDKKGNFNKLNGTSITSIEGSKIKIVINKKKDGSSVLIHQPKKMQSVLKSKILPLSNNDKVEKPDEGRLSPDSTSNSSCETRGKDSPPHNMNGEDIETSGFTLSACRMDTRYGKKYEAKYCGSNKIKVQPNSNIIKKESIDPDYKVCCAADWTPDISSKFTTTRTLDDNPISKDEIDQESFLSLFRLVSIAKCEVLKKKRCERKRRSVAGQSSLYSDYFQPTPKRTYTPRKTVVPVAVANNSNAVIIELPVADDEEEEKTKSSVCLLCHEEDGPLDSCIYCCESFHLACIPNQQMSHCPSCMVVARPNISSIVGGNDSIGSASSLELIKRYSSEEQILENGSSETKLSDDPIKEK